MKPETLNIIANIDENTIILPKSEGGVYEMYQLDSIADLRKASRNFMRTEKILESLDAKTSAASELVAGIVTEARIKEISKALDPIQATELVAGIVTEARIKEISKALDPIQATELVAGIVKIATTSEVAAGINNLSAVTPAKLKSLFVDGLNTSVNGYQKFPSGIIFQWGSILFTGLPDAALSSGSDTQVYFPIVFPNNCFVINVNGSGDVGNEGIESSHSYYNKTKSGFVHRTIRLQGNNGDGIEKGTASWIAIGY